ncbi:Glucose/ribitol dehydrogenase [Penicillium coprophilum]|uniref:Glucose/ribitol dehydrogenase n=1 Tax=Penicillium coprophilum TaxID=36646 RepID=UPI0023972191|nr:Glucose/ribitol dehydrogenase [Penicillium coprophilum]KAJ5169423.1 Glucose/ribitol dehydrogenase [Penicillium coprophilum]
MLYITHRYHLLIKGKAWRPSQASAPPLAYPPAPAFTEANAPPGSQTGRVFVVTGGIAGVGLEPCRILYASGATVYMASRSQTKAEAVIKSITKASKSKVTSGKLKFLHLDLNDLLVVKAVAKRFSQQEDKLDVLWNNAGTGANMVTIGQRTVQDFEPMIGMHCIATLLFTKLLLPQLRAADTSDESGKTRVAWTPSALVKAGSPPNGLDFDLLDKGTNRRTDNYGTSKAGTWILSREIARRYAKNGIVSFLGDEICGAYTELYAGFSSDITLESSGSYIIPWGRIRPNEATPRQNLIKSGDPRRKGPRLWEQALGLV